MRGVAILIVVLYHFFDRAFPLTSNQYYDFNPFRFGWMGVDLFFVLSGFLITRILLNTKQERNYFSCFYARRFLRILPLYYIALLFAIFFAPNGTNRQIAPAFWVHLSNLAVAKRGYWFGGGLDHFWSLAIEEQFYFLWPLLVKRTNERNLLKACFIGILVSTILKCSCLFNTKMLFANYVLTPCRLEPLIVGALIALLCNNEKVFLFIKRYSVPMLWCVLGVLITIYLFQKSFSPFIPVMQIIGFPIIALGFGILLFRCIDPTNLSPFFRNGFLRKLGKYSYSIYIFHIPLNGVLFPICQRNFGNMNVFQSVVLLPIFFMLYYLVGVMTWNLFEKHILEFKRYFAPGRKYALQFPSEAPLEVKEAA